MCWSLAASSAMVAVGSAAAVYTYRIKAPAPIWLGVGYFTIMETLQALGYFVADACGTTANQTITLLSYFHIVFQPFFINAFAMEMIPGEVSKRIRTVVYMLCAASTVFMLAQLVPLQGLGACRVGQVLCGADSCLRSGQWHIAWDIPYNGLGRVLDDAIGANWGFPSYVLTVFVLPLFYGSWRFTLFHLLVGPVLANYLTSDVNESPAIWCLFSIGIILISISPMILRQFRVQRWLLWPTTWTACRSA